MLINFDDIGQVCVSFRCDSDIVVGAPCAIERNRIVKPCAKNETFIGKVIGIRNNIANVVVKGFVTLPYSGEAPNVGHIPLSGDGAGCVTDCDGSMLYLVVDVDETNKTVTILL